MKIVNLPSLKVIRLKRVPEDKAPQSAKIHSRLWWRERREQGRGGGGEPPTTMSVETSVNFRHFLSLLLLNKSLSILAILLLGPCHKLKKTVKGSSNNSFSYTVKL